MRCILHVILEERTVSNSVHANIQTYEQNEHPNRAKQMVRLYAQTAVGA